MFDPGEYRFIVALWFLGVSGVDFCDVMGMLVRCDDGKYVLRYRYRYDLKGAPEDDDKSQHGYVFDDPRSVSIVHGYFCKMAEVIRDMGGTVEIFDRVDVWGDSMRLYELLKDKPYAQVRTLRVDAKA